MFFALLGCSYEFVKCYLNKKTDEDDEDENDSVSEQPQRQNENEEQENREKNYKMIFFIGFLGFLCQPLYLIFYLLYGLMECYRRFNCWCYYIDY
jgi:hypothetical protein